MGMKNKKFYFFIKRSFDIFFSLVLIIASFPFYLLFLPFIAISVRGNPIYLDKRLGKNMKLFRCIKLRTMRISNLPLKDQLGEELYKEFLKNYKLDNDPRITPFGKFLRKFSIDETPQIYNILFGQMSFIGPRPIKEDEYNRYWKNSKEIFNVRPGVTGYWATHGRSDIKDYDRRIKFETYYVNNCSLKLDFVIFFKSIVVVLNTKGAE